MHQFDLFLDWIKSNPRDSNFGCPSHWHNNARLGDDASRFWTSTLFVSTLTRRLLLGFAAFGPTSSSWVWEWSAFEGMIMPRNQRNGDKRVLTTGKQFGHIPLTLPQCKATSQNYPLTRKYITSTKPMSRQSTKWPEQGQLHQHPPPLMTSWNCILYRCTSI